MKQKKMLDVSLTSEDKEPGEIVVTGVSSRIGKIVRVDTSRSKK